MTRARLCGGSALALALLLPVMGCGAGGTEDEADLTVLAAASLTDVYEELALRFEKEQGARVRFSFGSSTDLAGQAADGAPGDVLSTADEASMQPAEDAGVARRVVPFAVNVMVIVTPAGNPARIEGLDDLDGTTWIRCADDVPCGRAARAVLEDHGVTAEPASLEDDVRATLDKVLAGEADAGLVYASDAVAAGDAVETIDIPGSGKQPTTYLTTVLEQSKDPDLAQEWVDLLTSDDGRAALRQAGFGLTSGTP